MKHLSALPGFNCRLLAAFALLLVQALAHAQILNVKKLALDSLKAGDNTGSLGLGFSFNRDDEKSTFFSMDASLMFTSKRHSAEALGTAFYQGFVNASTSNRNSLLARLNGWRYKEQAVVPAHDSARALLRERRFNPEFFFFFQHDESRGLRSRFQQGVNAVYNFSGLAWLRFNAGLGLLYEQEKWRLFENEYIDFFENLDPALQDLVQDFYRMDDRFNVHQQNIRLNLFVSAYIQTGDVFSLNVYGALQPPFKPPYEGLPPVNIFPPVDKRYPRYTIDLVANFKISRSFGLVSRLYLQHDKGQIAPFAPDEIWNISQGFSYKW